MGSAGAVNFTLYDLTNSKTLWTVAPSTGVMTLYGDLTFSDGKNLVCNTATGTKLGTATNQKLGFYNASPIVQPTGDIVTALGNLGLVASPTITTPSYDNFLTGTVYLVAAGNFYLGPSITNLPAGTWWVCGRVLVAPAFNSDTVTAQIYSSDGGANISTHGDTYKPQGAGAPFALYVSAKVTIAQARTVSLRVCDNTSDGGQILPTCPTNGVTNQASYICAIKVSS